MPTPVSAGRFVIRAPTSLVGVDYFVSQLQIVLPVPGVNAIGIPVSKPMASSPGDATGSPVFHLRQLKAGVDAQAQQIDGEFNHAHRIAGGRVLARRWQGAQH